MIKNELVKTTPRELIAQQPKDVFRLLHEFLQDHRLKALADRVRQLDLNEFTMLWYLSLRIDDVITALRNIDPICDAVLPQKDTQEKKTHRFSFSFIKDLLTGKIAKDEKRKKLKSTQDAIFAHANEAIGSFLLELYTALLNHSLTPEKMNDLIQKLGNFLEVLLPMFNEVAVLLNERDPQFKEPQRLFEIVQSGFPRKLERLQALKDFFAELGLPETQQSQHFQGEMKFFHDRYTSYQELAKRSKVLSDYFTEVPDLELKTAKMSQQDALFSHVNSLMDVHTAMVVSNTLQMPMTITKPEDLARHGQGIHSLVTLGFSDPNKPADPFYEAVRGVETGKAFHFETQGSVSFIDFKESPHAMLMLPADVLDLLTPKQLQEVFHTEPFKTHEQL